MLYFFAIISKSKLTKKYTILLKGKFRMVYTEREKLTVIELSEEKDILTFDELEAVLWGRPSNMVYAELSGLLYGIVSMGRVRRAYEAGKNYVEISKRFTRIQSGEYMRARQIFKEKENINAIPVIDEKGRLLGDYIRWDDMVRSECLPHRFNKKYIGAALTNVCKHAVLVKPCGIFERKQRLFAVWKNILETYMESVEVVEREHLPAFSDKDDVTVLFTDTDEQNGIATLFHAILKKPIKRMFTFKELSQRLSLAQDDLVFFDTHYERAKRFLEDQGIHFLSVGFEENERGYLGQFQAKLDQKYKQTGETKSTRLLPQAKASFFGEIYNDEYEKGFFPPLWPLVFQNGVYRPEDRDLPLFHVHDGERLTVGQPEVQERCVYMYGPCTVFGLYAEDKHTIESWLQDRLNSAGQPCKVVNYGIIAALGDISAWVIIAATPLKKGDIVIVLNYENSAMGNADINLTDVLEKNDLPTSWFVDAPYHCNYKVNKHYADAIYDAILPILQEPVSGRESIEMAEMDFRNSLYINRNFGDFDPSAHGTIGSIVMNCNPFTFGHRYLIESALKMVDHLIIFVVEEDRSLFTFEERFAMVKNGVADLKNVSVVPSGSAILSQATFPEYFVKVLDENIVQNVENDITIFAEKIAPKLNITYRFVGEEPEDAVTNEYNSAMKRILPAHGIKLVEIPRIETEGRIISATSVRKCLEEENYEKLDSLVPESTKRLLFLKNE